MTKAGLHIVSFVPLLALAGLSLASCAPPDSSSGGSGGRGSGGAGAGSGSGGVGSGGAQASGGGPGASGGGVGSGGAANPGTGGSATGGAAIAGTGGRGGASNASAGGTAGGAAGARGGGGNTAGAGGTSNAPASPENGGANCNASAGALKKNAKLPNPFAMHDGMVITTKAEWQCRRNEILKDLEKYEIGPKPTPPTVQATLSGKALSVKVTTASGTITLTSDVSGSGSCVVIGMNRASNLVSGCTQVPFSHDQVVTYSSNSTQNMSDPFYRVYPALFGKIGNYSAWAWGISRLIDGLEQVKSQLGIDTTKIATHGCSYAGKMSLFAGALDERVALTVVQESGGGGINAWRTSQDFTARTGTSIEKIDNTNFGWFMPSMKTLDPYSLPHDHHGLIAMIAPRATVILGNGDFEWLGDESGYKSTVAAIEVWKALGVADRIGYDFTSGHPHCEAAASQTAAVKTFVDRYLKGGTASPNVAVKPTSTKFNLDTAGVIDWPTPTLQ